jgi:hypothetical protein
LVIFLDEGGIGPFGNGNGIHGNKVWKIARVIASLPPSGATLTTGGKWEHSAFLDTS